LILLRNFRAELCKNLWESGNSLGDGGFYGDSSTHNFHFLLVLAFFDFSSRELSSSRSPVPSGNFALRYKENAVTPLSDHAVPGSIDDRRTRVVEAHGHTGDFKEL
jgi:hypothetical protein